MPTSRPSAGTFSANLNAAHTIVSNALGLWVVDAQINVPDLKGTQPDASQSSFTYSSAAPLGGAFAGLGLGSGAAAISHPLAVPFGAFPFVVGVVFTRTGTKSSSSGAEWLFALGDSASSSGIFAAILIGDGTVAGETPGDIMGFARTASGGSVDSGNSGQYVASSINTAVIVFYDSSGRKMAGYLNGSKIFDTSKSLDAFIGDTYAYATGLALDRFGVIAGEVSTSTSVAAWWYSQTQLTDQDYIDWTGDPWSITSTAAAPQSAYPIADDDVVSWQALSPETVRNLLTYTEAFDNAAWTKTGCTVTADAGLDPDGGTTADDLVEDGGNSTHSVKQLPPLTASLDYTLYVYAKPLGRNWLLLQILDLAGGSNFAYFDLSNGTIGTTSGVTWSISGPINGLYLCSITCNAGTGSYAFTYAEIGAASADGSATYGGSSSAALRLSRAQFEQASAPSTYQPKLATTPPLAISSTVFPALADGSTGTPDDTTWAFVLVPGVPYWFKFGPTTTPVSLTGTVLNFRGLSPQLRSLQVDVYQGYLGTLIATRTINLTASVAESNLSLTDPELALVTDLNDIHGRMVGLA